MKKIFCVVSLFFLMALLVADMHQGIENVQANSKIVVRVGYDKAHGVIDEIDSLDRRGFGYDILKRVEHYSDYMFEFIEYEYWDAIDALRSGDIDLFGIKFQSNENEEKYYYVPSILGTAQLLLATKDSEIYYDDPIQIDRKTVASYYGNPYEQYLNEYSKKNAVSITYVRDTLDNYINLDADYYLVTNIDRKAKSLKTVLNLELFDMHFVTNKDQVDLGKSISDAIYLAVSADGNFLKELQIKYYGAKNLTRRFLTQAELDLLRSKTLVCGYIDHHQPIQFTNKKGEPDGISIQVMNQLSKQYGFTIEYLPYNHTSEDCNHDDFDMIISSVGESQHELQYYTPSNPFFQLPLMLFAESDAIDQIISEDYDSKIGMLNYITIDHDDIEKRYPNNTLKSYQTYESLIDSYNRKDIEGIIATEHGVEFAQAVIGKDNHRIHSTGLSLPLRIFFSNKSEYLTEYLGIFNIMFDHLEKTRFDEIISYQSALFLPEYSVQSLLKKNLGVLATIILALLFVLLLIVFYYQYARKKAILQVINHDSLTNLISMYKFTVQAKSILQNASAGEYEMISFDIDSFRTINSVYSKHKGDAVIKAVASSLVKSYIGTNALVSRIIADQFVIFRKISEGDCIEKVCEENVTSAIKDVMGEKYNLSLSVGICVIKDTNLAVDTIIDRAVAAHMKGKNKYRITYHVYDDKIDEELKLKASIVHRMKDALHNNEFKVFYQPKITFDTLKIGGVEAVVRWFDSNNNIVSTPDVFIRVFEANGFITNLDLYVFEEVCKFILTNENDIDIPLISVNVSTVTVFDDRFPSEYFDLLEKYSIKPQRLEIEITESAIAFDQKVLVEKARQIRDFGIQLSIDDFGAGESSLNRLNTIIADTIKLDKAFLDNNIGEERGYIVVDTVIKMAKQLNMKVVSEGVETADQVQWLKELNCDYAQGYFFEKPLSTEDFKHVLKSEKSYAVAGSV